MRKISFVVAALVLVLLSFTSLKAKDIYVSQNGAGNANGLDMGDAYPEVWINTATNWGSATTQVNPGDTVHLVGTFSNPLVVAGSGAAQNPVTIFFEPGANFTSPCWSVYGAIQLNGQSWIVIDGGSNGLIQNVANGTSLATQNNSIGVQCIGFFIVIQNLTITNIYRNIPGDATRAGYGVSISGSSLTVSNCNLSDGDSPLVYSGPQPGSYSSESNILILNNRILNFNHGITIGIGNQAAPPQNCYLTNLIIAGNLIDHSDVFDEPSGSHHLDDIIILNSTYDPTVVISGFRIYQNTFGSHFGVHNTAAIFTDLANPLHQVQNYYIYNNLFLATSNSWGNGFVVASGSNVWVVNNTCMGTNGLGGFAGGTLGIGGTNAFCYNNLMMTDCGLNLAAFTSATVSGVHNSTNDLFVLTNYFGGVWSDYNVIVGPTCDFGLTLGSTSGGILWQVGSGFHSLAQWQTYVFNTYGWPTPVWNARHCDPHSTTNTPTFQNTVMPNIYVPGSSDIVANGLGTNLFFLGITNDFSGTPRPASGRWTVGAFQAASTAPLPSPTGLHFLSQ